MSTTEEPTPARRFGWLPKLLLWALVIAIGVLYLASTSRHRDEAESEAVAGGEAPPAEMAAAAPSPADVETAEGPDPVTADVVPDLEPGRHATTGSDSGHEGPVQAAEAEAFASSVMTAEPAPAETGPADAAPERGTSASVPGPPVATQTPPPGSAPSASEPRSAAMPSAASPDLTGANSLTAPPVQGTRSATGDPAPAPAVRPESPPPETLEQRRARILTEYEAMRRAAGGSMGRGWGGYPGPGATPYGYPGGGPGFGPPGYPRGYMPRPDAR